MTVASRFRPGRSLDRPLPVLLVIALLAAALAPMAAIDVARGAGGVAHLVISEVVTGGTSASDELIELHNPTAVALPLEGLEVIYVTATGATTTRRAAWELGAPSVPAGGHVLITNASGIYASVADATYASGMAATGGSVAIRILGASTPIDAVGWGSAASAWMEGTAVAAPVSAASIERLPGGDLGSGQDTADNAVDFVERAVPRPQNLGSPPTPGSTDPVPSAEATPGSESTSTPGPTPTPPPTTPTATPSPVPTPIVEARAAPDGSTVTVEGVALTGSGFHDGGGFVADATGGIAVLVTDGAFGQGEHLRVTGELDDRFSQRTLRADAGSLVILGFAADPAPATAATGSVDESHEGRLVRLSGAIVGSPTVLSSGLAFDVDDGSGAIRILVGTATGIDTGTWQSRSSVELVGVAGQRDSTGSGTDGYRVLPRDPDDVIDIAPPPEPTPSTPSGGPSQAPSPSGGGDGVTTIAAARRAATGADLTIRGVVTLPTGLVDDGTAVVQDATGAIVLRLGEEAGRLVLGARIEADGTRSTLSGMETLRVSEAVQSLGTAAEPGARERRTGDVAEADEARLIVARGAIVASARRSSSGTVFFEIDDGSGPLDVSLAGTLRADRDALVAGAWVEVRGVLGQETSRAEPNEGYRIWPRSASEVRITAPATGGEGQGEGTGRGSGGGSAGPTGSLDDLDAADLSRLRIGATLVVGRWKEVGIGGLLWDGSHLVAVHTSSGERVARLTRERRPPLALDLGGLQPAGTDHVTGAPAVRLGPTAGQTVVLADPPAPPRGTLAGALPAWVSVVGELSGSRSRRVLVVDGRRVAVDERCESDDDARTAASGAIAVTGVALGDPLRLIVPCGGVRAVPSIVSGASLTALDGEEDGSPTDRASISAGTPPDPRRPIVAGLLLAAALVLVGGAAIGRRRRARDDEPPSAGAPDDPSVAAPVLTLVRVPHEGDP